MFVEPKLVRRYNQQHMATIVRRDVSVEVLINYCRAVMAGHGEAVVMWDENHPEGGYASWPEHGERLATPEQIAWAFNQLRSMGWGQAATAKEAEEMFARGTKDQIPVEGTVPLATIAAIRGLLTAGGSTSASTPHAPDPDPTSAPHELDEGAIEVGDLHPPTIMRSAAGVDQARRSPAGSCDHGRGTAL